MFSQGGRYGVCDLDHNFLFSCLSLLLGCKQLEGRLLGKLDFNFNCAVVCIILITTASLKLVFFIHKIIRLIPALLTLQNIMRMKNRYKCESKLKAKPT